MCVTVCFVEQREDAMGQRFSSRKRSREEEHEDLDVLLRSPMKFRFVVMLFVVVGLVYSDALADGVWLAALYNATNGPGWYSSCRFGWNIANPGSVCSAGTAAWYGVQCNASTSSGVVVSVDLQNCNLRGGPVPDVAPPVSGHVGGALQYCTTLYLCTNRITNTLPSSFGKLSALQILHVHTNSLTGTLPASYGNMSALQFLSLHANSLTGSLPASYGSLSSLQELHVHTNSITGSLPASYGSLSSSQILSLHTNSLTGSLPASYGSLSSLQELHLHTNSITGSLPASYGSLSSLQQLYLHRNSLTGALPASYGNMSALQFLSLHTNSLTGTLPPAYSGLSSLQRLVLFNNSLTGSLPSSFSSLLSLQQLDFFNNSFTGTLPPSYANLPSLVYLLLHSNSLTGSLPPSYGSLRRLQYLYLTNNSLSGTLPSSWYLMRPASSGYDLSNNYLTGDIPSSWLWSNATIRGNYVTGNCLNISNMLAVMMTWRFDAFGTPRSNASECYWIPPPQPPLGVKTSSASISISSRSSRSTLVASETLTVRSIATTVSNEQRHEQVTDLSVTSITSSVVNPKKILRPHTAIPSLVQNPQTVTVSETVVVAVAVAVMPRRQATPFPTTTQSLVALLSSFGTASSAAFTMQRSCLLLRLLACEMRVDDPPDMMTSPTQLQIRSSNDVQRFQRGAVVGNTCVLIGLAMGCGLAAWALTCVRGDRGFAAWWRVAGTLHLPGWLVIFWSFLLQPFVAAIACLLLLQPAAAIDLVIGFVSLSMIVVVLGMEVRLLVFCFNATRKHCTTRRAGNKQFGWFLKFTSSSDGCEWCDSDAYSCDNSENYYMFVKHYGALFEAYLPGARRLFHLVDSLFAVVCGVLQAVATVHPQNATSTCSGEILYTLCALQVVYFLMMVLWRPQAKTSEWIIATVLSSLGAIAALLAVIPTCSDGWCGSAAVEVSQVQVYLAFADLCVIAAAALWSGRLKRFFLRLMEHHAAPSALTTPDNVVSKGEPCACEPAVDDATTPDCSQNLQQQQHPRPEEAVDIARLVQLAELIEHICTRVKLVDND